MSQKRHAAVFDRSRDRRSAITTLTYDYARDHVIPLHFHDRDQLVYASRGVMTIRADEGTWVVPTHRAVWIPARVAHTISMSGKVAMRTLYLKSSLAKTLPRHCCVVNISPLLRQLILHACTFRALKKTVRSQLHLIDLILDQLQAIQAVPLQLPRLADPRAARVAALLVANPSNPFTLAEICRKTGTGVRTVERLFQQDAGMTFGRWRQQLRLMHALRLLAEGAKVTHAALDAGYSTPSAFISMFRKTLGTTPTGYFTISTRV